MSLSDARRWNQRYQEETNRDSFHTPHSFLIEQAALLPPGGRAVDVAMGLGANAGFLVQRGFSVVGVDISTVAVQHAAHQWPALMPVVADLSETIPLPSASFDVILNFYYLQRRLWTEYNRILRPGGIIIMQTFTQDIRQIKPQIGPDYLLQAGELRQAFSAWDILVSWEGWETAVSTGHRRATAKLIARRPAHLPEDHTG